MTKQNLIIVVLLAVLSLTGTVATAQFESSTGYLSNYLWRGERLTQTTCIEEKLVATNKKFDVGISHVYDSNKKDTFKNEYSLVYKTNIKLVQFNVGYIKYDLNNKKDTQEVFAQFKFKGFLHPAVTMYFDVQNNSGKYIQFSASQKIAALKLGLNVGCVLDNGYLGLTKQMQEFSGLYHGEATLALPIKLAKDTFVEPFIAYSVPLSHNAKEAMQNVSGFTDTSYVYGGLVLKTVF